jgi:hypothetical protein
VSALTPDQLRSVGGGYYSIPCGTQGCTIYCPTLVGCDPQTTGCPM